MRRVLASTATAVDGLIVTPLGTRFTESPERLGDAAPKVLVKTREARDFFLLSFAHWINSRRESMNASYSVTPSVVLATIRY